MNIQKYIGTITPTRWSRRGKTLDYSLYTDEGEDILLDCPKKNRLQKFIGKKVKVEGLKKTDNHDENVIKPKSIKKIARNIKNKIKDTGDELIDYSVNIPDYLALQLLADSFERA